MTSTIDAARQTQSTAQFHTVYRCKACKRALSVAEFIERHCEECATETEPFGVREKSA